MFQYHTGPIKRLFELLSKIAFDMFQYHTGPIKSLNHLGNDFICINGFNTTLVQLKVMPERVQAWRQASFNTTLVQLKGSVNIRSVFETQFPFQYHTGPIKSWPILPSLKSLKLVSIPHWSN